MTLSVVHSAKAEDPLAAAREWLLDKPLATEFLVIGASLEAARELFLHAVQKVGPGLRLATGWHSARHYFPACR